MSINPHEDKSEALSQLLSALMENKDGFLRELSEFGFDGEQLPPNGNIRKAVRLERFLRIRGVSPDREIGGGFTGKSGYTKLSFDLSSLSLNKSEIVRLAPLLDISDEIGFGIASNGKSVRTTLCVYDTVGEAEPIGNIVVSPENDSLSHIPEPLRAIAAAFTENEEEAELTVDGNTLHLKLYGLSLFAASLKRITDGLDYIDIKTEGGREPSLHITAKVC